MKVPYPHNFPTKRVINKKLLFFCFVWHCYIGFHYSGVGGNFLFIKFISTAFDSFNMIFLFLAHLRKLAVAFCNFSAYIITSLAVPFRAVSSGKIVFAVSSIVSISLVCSRRIKDPRTTSCRIPGFTFMSFTFHWLTQNSLLCIRMSKSLHISHPTHYGNLRPPLFALGLSL